MEQISVSFKDLNSLVNWCKRVAEDPQEALFGATEPKTTKKKEKETEPAAIAKKEEKAETPAAETTGVSKMLVDLKEIGVELTEMQPSRYEGVQLALASFGVTKIKELTEDQQVKALKMFNKMKAASKEDYAEMLEYLK